MIEISFENFRKMNSILKDFEDNQEVFYSINWDDELFIDIAKKLAKYSPHRLDEWEIYNNPSIFNRIIKRAKKKVMEMHNIPDVIISLGASGIPFGIILSLVLYRDYKKKLGFLF